MKSGIGSAIGLVVVVVALLITTLVVGWRPLLGLDLRGGVEVVLRPADDAENLALAADEDNLDRAAEIIRRRVDAIGVAEPDITVQDTDIVVQLPGVEDQQRAVELVGATAELRFRPVLYPPINILQLEQASVLYQQAHGAFDNPDEVAANIAAVVASSDFVTGGDDGEDESGLSMLVPGGESAAAAFQTDDGEAGTDDAGTGDDNPLVVEADTGESPFLPDNATQSTGGAITLDRIAGVNGGFGTDQMFSGQLSNTAETDVEDGTVVLTDGRFIYLLGPTIFTGAALDGAEAQLLGAGWNIAVDFKSGAEGVDLLNEAADMCFFLRQTCPTGSMATVLDRNITQTVGFEAPVFEDDVISISRGQFGFLEEEARDTALVLDFGALPVEFQDPTEAGLVRTVSSTLGEGSLRSGLIAGAIGVMLVALYMIWYYRLLGVAAILSLVLSASMLYVIVSFLSEQRGLALTLAGIVGLIVSIGVSLDSNVVYFEHLKESIGNGLTLRSATDKAFPIAFNTVFWANMATLIGAVILWVLTVGSVKGFALMLGIASILDLVATYFFMRPFVRWLAFREGTENKPGQFGIGIQAKVTEA